MYAKVVIPGIDDELGLEYQRNNPPMFDITSEVSDYSFGYVSSIGTFIREKELELSAVEPLDGLFEADPHELGICEDCVVLPPIDGCCLHSSDWYFDNPRMASTPAMDPSLDESSSINWTDNSEDPDETPQPQPSPPLGSWDPSMEIG